MAPLPFLQLSSPHHLLRTALGLTALVLAIAAQAAVRCPAVFSDHMVLQRDTAVPVWGEADPGEVVTLEFAGQRKSATADTAGRWQIALDPLPANTEPRVLTVSGSAPNPQSAIHNLQFRDVLVGEVWLCSGQSNMEKPVGQQRGQQPTDNAAEEIRTATHPLLRLYQVPRSGRAEPGDLSYRWLPCSPESLDGMHFSAAGYFFGRELLQKLQVPVGLIHSSYGGTRIEVWTPPEGFARMPSLQAFGAAAAAKTKYDGIEPSSLYRSMVEPIVPYAVRGFLWYQGESNLMNVESDVYADKMRALVESWRAAWGRDDLPFYYVHLAPFRYSTRRAVRPLSAEALPRFWEVQANALSIPHTAMAVITDLIGNVKDIHPTAKREVGQRLAALALADTYGRRDIATSGPVFAGLQLRGADAELAFAHADGLRSRDGHPLTDFTIAGPDRTFVPATATLCGDKVIVSASGVPSPVAVRFGWREDAMPNLVNLAGLPARPFRTDDWPVTITRPAGPADIVTAPLPKVSEPQIPDTAVKLTDFGGVGDGRTLNTSAFAAAIEAVAAKGGGRVVVPAGLWLTGPIVLRSRVELRVERGALVQFSDNRDDYPLVEATWEGRSGWQCQSPISGRNLEHVAITGEGILDGAGQSWRPVKREKLTAGQWTQLKASGGVVDAADRLWYPSEGSRRGNETRGARATTDAAGRAAIKDALRPVMVSLVECRFIKLEGVTFQNSPAWCLHPLLCDDLTVRRVNVRNPWYSQNGDGLDPESCRNVLIEQSTFDVGDDAICLKSGRDAEGRRRGRPTENVTVRDCTVYHGHGGFVIGSEMSGGIRNVRVSDCTFIGTDVGLRFKSTRGRGGVVENVLVERIRMTNIPGEAILFDLFYGGPKPTAGAAPTAIPLATEETPAFRNIVVRDLVCRGAKRAALLQGLPEMPLQGLVFENVTITADAGIVATDVDGLEFSKIQVQVGSGPALELHDARAVRVQNLAAEGPVGPVVRVAGPRSGEIRLPPALLDSGKTSLGADVPAGAVGADSQ